MLGDCIFHLFDSFIRYTPRCLFYLGRKMSSEINMELLILHRLGLKIVVVQPFLTFLLVLVEIIVIVIIHIFVLKLLLLMSLMLLQFLLPMLLLFI